MARQQRGKIRQSTFRKYSSSRYSLGFFKGYLKPKLSGKTTGLSMNKFLAKLFDSNELASPKGKLTDEEIAKKIIEEFGDESKWSRMLQSYNGEGRSLVARIRSEYNRGLYDPWLVPPIRRSFRYGRGGVVLDAARWRIDGSCLPMHPAKLRKKIREHSERRAKQVVIASEHLAEMKEAHHQALRDRKRKTDLIKDINRRKAKYIEKAKKLRAQGFVVPAYKDSDEGKKAELERMIFDYQKEFTPRD